jgi:hypothetical protein
MKLRNPNQVKFINAFVRSGDIDIAIKESGVSQNKAKELISRYKSIYEGFFEKMGLCKEDVIKEHIALIKNPIKSTTLSPEGELKTSFDTTTKMKAIDTYYKLIKALDGEGITVQTNIFAQVDSETEKAIMEEINKNENLQELFMKRIEKMKQGGNKS